ncbi:LiaI-LiaF-like domain-containing protein [Aquibacillus albus]|uniref:LiaI-LiaF-like transmembrane region domain-containing protein n=1 Tax=Aquibacillus albus TaxID=1168171 RepID=A0ABS2N1J1_9BACI|nr:DUF5668 domain-containing protein [Aquibacillus albus]MBM7572004.1 hypothetical protein [Aquibacillus albus]
MRKQNAFIGYLLIGIGAFYLFRQLQLPIFTNFYSWPTLLIIIGISFLLHSYGAKEYGNLFPGAILLGLGLHFHSVNHYSFWINHWGMYPLIIGIAFLLSYSKTRSGLIPGLILLFISLFAIFVTDKPEWFGWINEIVLLATNFWPIILIIGGGYFLLKKK